jgi:hypothetical protein
MILPPLAHADDADARDLAQQRLEVGRALIEVQASNWPSIIPYYTEDIEYHDPVVDIIGLDTMTEFLARMFTSSPDLITIIEDDALDGPTYSATWTMAGQFDGVPYTARGISIVKFRDSTAQVYYQRDYYSEGDIMVNIPGLDEAVTGFRTFYRCAVDPTYECPLRDAGDLAMSRTLPQDEAQERRPLRPWLRQRQLEVGRALIEINASNWPSLIRYYTGNIEYHDPVVDIQGIRTMSEFLGRLFASSPNLITTVQDEALSDGLYTATWVMEGDFAGVPIVARGMSIVKFRGASQKVHYARDYYSEGDIMASIPGLDVVIDAFRTYYRCAVDPTFECPLAGRAALAELARAAAGTSETPDPVAAFTLQQNAPNPFNPATEIRFSVPAGGASVSLRVYDVTGRLVRTLVDGHRAAGTHTVTWQGDDDRGRPAASGTYVYRLTAPSFSELRTMVLLK